MMSRRSWLYAVVLLMFWVPVAAQSTTGTIQGTVRDNQDAVVPGAAVAVRNVQTNAVRSLTTDPAGFYRFLNMPVGEYELTVDLAGFGKHVRSGITLAMNQDAVVNVGIQPASISENVEVRGERRSTRRRAAAQYDDARSRCAFRYDADRRASGERCELPRRLRRGAVSAWRQPAR
ncbi:MAG: carboxypeptidase-like regulatory domain-containing protein [Acidobacteriota bacterium]|nr:carboxypeptidase-like regulatory domain-containing protein [Acidobacteriota bacterium]